MTSPSRPGQHKTIDEKEDEGTEEAADGTGSLIDEGPGEGWRGELSRGRKEKQEGGL